jgi:hypothetical protein
MLMKKYKIEDYSSFLLDEDGVSASFIKHGAA